MATFVARRLKSGETRVTARVRMRGVNKTETFRSKTQARKWATAQEGKIIEGGIAPVHTPSHPIEDVISRYEVESLAQKRPSTRSTENVMLRFWLDRLGGLTTSEITTAMIMRERSTLTCSASSRDSYVYWLKHLFSMAVKWGMAGSNPAAEIPRESRGPRGRTRYLSKDERDRLLFAAKQYGGDEMYLAVVMALSTGLRLGEQFGLRWRDIDLQKGIARIEKSKSGATRAVPLTGLILTLLRGLPHKNEEAHIFSGECWVVYRGLLLMRNTFYRNWKWVLEMAGIKDFRWHDLRHSFASELAMSGATQVELAEALGHTTLTMVKRYAHVSDPHTASVVMRMNERVFGDAY